MGALNVNDQERRNIADEIRVHAPGSFAAAGEDFRLAAARVVRSFVRLSTRALDALTKLGRRR